MTKLLILQLVLGALTTYRASILVTRDTFPFGPPRDWLVRTYRGRLVELVQCAWCISVWLAAVIWVLTLFCWGPVLLGFEVVFTFSAITGFLNEHS